MLARQTDHRLRRTLAIGASLALGLAGSLLVAAPASATSSTVSNTNDSGAGSLRQAILDANADAAADTITITATGTLALASNLPLINQPVTIVGPAGGFTIDASAVDFGLGIDGTATPGIEVALSDLSVANAADDGIRSESADLTLTRVSSSDNDDNGIFADQGNLTFTDVTVDGNDDDGLDLELSGDYTALITGLTSTDSGSNGIDADVYDDAVLTVDDAQISDNEESGISVDDFDAVVTITGSTVEGNHGGPDICAGGIEIDSNDSKVEVAETTISGNSGNVGGLCVDAWSSDVSLHDLLIEDNDGEDGGGIHLDLQEGSDPLVIADSRILGNSAEDNGGGIFVHSPGNNGDYAGIQILRTTIDGNSAGNGGGIAIENLWPTGTPGTPGVFIQDSTISDNEAYASGGGLSIMSDIGATDPLFSSLVIESSTISGNTADGGGGLYEGLGSELDELTTLNLTIINSTISGNVAEIVGGLYVSGDGLSEDSAVNILNSTITDNTVEDDGPAGVAILGDFAATIQNSIIAGNIDLPVDYGDLDISDDLAVDISYSLIGVPSTRAAGAASTGTGNITGVDPGLGPLADNGGPTLTHLPQDNSPAVEAGDPAFTGLATDQRGQNRVVNRLDMGSVELPPALAATGADTVVPLAGGALLLGVGGLLLVARRRRAAR